MSVWSSDEVFSRYHGEAPLDDAFVHELKQALLEPQSSHLREVLVRAIAALATRPSNVILPGKAGPDHEGDLWWNGAPPRANALVGRYG
jgi:hypothetical protein